MKLKDGVILAIVTAVGGLFAYDYYSADLHLRPDMPEGAFSLSFADGPRVILQDMEDESFTRRYLARSYKSTPEWYRQSWSFCTAPSEAELAEAESRIASSPGMRLDAVCTLDVEGEIIPMAQIYSVPRL